MAIDLQLDYLPQLPKDKSVPIGCIGAGMIMAECHLAAYKEAGFPVVAIASRTKVNAAKVAERWGIGRVHDTPEALIADPEVEIVDLAFPPERRFHGSRASLESDSTRRICGWIARIVSPGAPRAHESKACPLELRTTRSCAPSSPACSPAPARLRLRRAARRRRTSPRAA